MRIAVTTGKGGMDDNVCQDFDECHTITFVDSSSMTAKIHNIPKSKKGTAGKTIAQAIIDKWAVVVITGVCTPDAMKLFFKANVRVYSGFGRVKDVVTALLKGRLNIQKMPKVGVAPPGVDVPESGSLISQNMPR